MDMEMITDLMEAVMILCFGLSWPISIRKSWVSRTAKGKSLFFECFIWIGYVFGIARKFMQLGMSILYSLAGGILSFLVMLLLKRIKGFSMIGISIAGGVSHNIGQIVVAMCVLENTKLIYYLPVLMIAGTVTGILIGVVSRKILPAVSQGAGAERKNK